MNAFRASLVALLFAFSVSADEEKPTYNLDNKWEFARLRLQALEEINNPRTFELLKNKIGIQPGWICLDAGSGLGLVAEWMAEQVGSSGKVVATDIEPRFLKEKESSNLQVLRHDITKDPLPDDYYDLIHARNLLMHLPDKESVIKRLVQALKPGGTLVVDDMGIFEGQYRLSTLHTSEEVWQKEAKDYEMLEKNNIISFHSSYLNHKLFRDAGLVNIRAETQGRLAQGGNTPESRFMFLSTLQMEPLQNPTPEQTKLYESILEAYKNENSFWWDHFQVATWGRKPKQETSSASRPSSSSGKAN